jgi:hypothetical protein
MLPPVALGLQVSLGWTAASDNVGVTAYLLERCQGIGCTSFVEIATVTETSFIDVGVLVNITYRYRVRAKDAAGNHGPYSNITGITLTLGL